MTKALALLSGGLDSMLAIRLMQEQGIEVEAVTCSSPFFSAQKARQAASTLGVPLREIDISIDVLEVVKAPKHGHGRFMNPCVDCHALMIRRAWGLRDETGADFVITGEVLGERPKSQNIHALKVVAVDSGADGYLIRPLSAKLLMPSIPETEGIVDRSRLQDIEGRSRKRQLVLAARFGISDFPTPAGGCLLTEGKFSLRLKDLLQEKDNPTPNELALLKWGRHFRSSQGTRIVVSRNEAENEEILKLVLRSDVFVELADIPGPTVIVRGDQRTGDTIKEAAALAARYSKARNADKVRVSYRSGDEQVSGQVVVESPLKSIMSGNMHISVIDEGEFKDLKAKAQNA